MLIKRIANATRVMKGPEDTDVIDLAIRDVPTEVGNFMVSAWEPTPDELEKMKNGETVKLWISGKIHPFVAITVGEENL